MLRLTTLNFSNPVGQAFWILRVIFTVGPILFGLDKFLNVMVNWSEYLAPWIPSLVHVSPQTFMYGVGVVEIAAGILVGLWPHYFAYFVTVWLLGVIVNLLSTGQHFDIVLRDFGLSMSVLALGRLGYAHYREKRGPVEIETVGTPPSVEPRPRPA